MKFRRTVPIQFPPGEIHDRDGFVWATLPPETGLSESRILGTCSCDPLALVLAQVTVERGDWCLDLLSPGQEAAFPLDRGFLPAVPGLEQHDVRAWSTVDAPVKVTVHVKRSFGITRDDRGRLLLWPDPVSFQLVLLARGAEEVPS